MAVFPTTSDEIKSWIWNTLGEEEIGSVEVIKSAVDQNDIDGKMLLLLYKYPHEIQLMLPNLRTRLLFMNALDVLMKTVGNDLPASLRSYDVPTRSLLSRLASKSNVNSKATYCNRVESDEHGYPTSQSSAVNDRRTEDASEMASPAGIENHCSALNNVQETLRQEIPSPVPLPVFDHVLQQAILNGRLKDRCIRSRLANVCARFYVNLKMYPTQMDYHKICEKLVEKYPELMDAQPRIRSQPWGHLKKSLSMAFCNVRRIMKMKDLTSARHIISSIQKRYRGFGRDGQRHLVLPIGRRSFAEDSDSSCSNEDSSSMSLLRSDVFSSPPPIPTFSQDLQRAIEVGKLKDRPWSSQFFRRCARFYSKLKPYPTRRDYKNISEHLAKTFPELGHSGHVKHMLSQYIRSHRQSAKLWKLDKQQRARMLTLELSGKKNFSQVNVKEENAGTSGGHTKHSIVGFEGSSGYEFQSGGNSAVKEGTQFSSYFTHYNDCGAGRIIPSSPQTLEAKQTVTFQGQGSPDSSLCYPVPLPPMDEVMWKGIREGQLQEKNLRNKFIRLCAGYYISLKSYPSKEDYNNICRTVITQFPDLKDPSPLPGCPPFMLFKKALTACIRNKRRDSVSPSAPVEWTVPQADSNPSQRSGVATVKLERPMDWTYFSHAQTTTQGANSYRDAATVPCPSGISELSLLAFPSAVEPHGRAITSQVKGFDQNRAVESGVGVCSHLPVTFQSGATSGMAASSGSMGHSANSCGVQLPSFSHSIKMLLDAGEPIENTARTAFLQNCADFYLSQKLFPNRVDISTICAQLVHAFPQLADSGVTPERISYANLQKDLTEHFCNYQQQMKACDEMAKGEKLTSNANSEAANLACAAALPHPSLYSSNVSVSSLVHL